MSKRIYQPIIVEFCNKYIDSFVNSGFFDEHGIEDDTFARNHLSDILTEKLINGGLDENEDFFTDDEFEQLLREIVAGSILYQLKSKGLFDSYEDDNTEEIFFLTEKGKKLMKETGGNISEIDDIPG